MTPNERFGLLIAVITVVGGATLAGLGYVFKRMFDRFDQANADRQALITQQADDRQAQNERHAQRNAEAVTQLAAGMVRNSDRLTSLYDEMNTRVEQTRVDVAEIKGTLNIRT